MHCETAGTQKNLPLLLIYEDLSRLSPFRLASVAQPQTEPVERVRLTKLSANPHLA